METDKAMELLRRQSKGEGKSLTRCESFSRRIIERYGDKSSFLTTFTFDREKTFCQDSDRCVLGHAPSMTQVNVTYGKNTSAAWLMPFLYDIGEFSGSREKMTRRQTEELAHIIVSTYGHLKVTEIMLFFWWFKCGRYGNFYGSVDPMVILSSLKKFMSDRNEIIDRDEREKRRREFEESRKNAITYEDWLRIKDGMEKENGDERKKNG